MKFDKKKIFFNKTGINETVSVFQLINELFLLKLVEAVIAFSKLLKEHSKIHILQDSENSPITLNALP